MWRWSGSVPPFAATVASSSTVAILSARCRLSGPDIPGTADATARPGSSWWLAIGLLLALAATQADAADRCTHDADALLALDEQAFDQDLSGGGGGWRAVANIPGCELEAADLLAAYRARHPDAGRLLAWHEGQLRASAGRYRDAIPLLDAARRPSAEDPAGWNHYVDATLAFLRRDRRGLKAARERLAAVPYPEDGGMPPLKDGYLEFAAGPGQPARRFRWPPNLDVVDGLLACFGKPYSQAYGMPCRPSRR